MDRLMSMRVFQRVVQEGGFAAAARVMDLSPAVVTRLVADLEEHLGTRLLHRTTRRLALTDAGDAYVERLRLILQDIDDADAAVSSQTQEVAGVLHIAASPLLARHVVAPLITGFRARYPRIRFDVDVTNAAMPAVEDHDVCLLGTNASFDANVIARRIVTTEAVLVAAPSYLMRRPAPQVPDDLRHHDCLRLRITGQRSGAWQLSRFEPEEETVQVEVTPVLWANHGDTLLHVALDGGGITSTTLELAAPYLATGELRRVLKPWVTGRLSLYAAVPSRKFMPERTRIFLDYLSEQMQQKMNEAAGRC